MSDAPAGDILRVRNLSVIYPIDEASGAVHALDGVSFDLMQGEALAIVGETGSGKTTLALTLMGLATGARVAGEIDFQGQPLPYRDEGAMRAVRWRSIALAFQGAGSAFNPVSPISQQIMEPLVTHLQMEPRAARERALELWEAMGLPTSRFDYYAHQLSGGEKQRAMLAMALSCDPDLLIVDEPTSGLDVLTQARILDLLNELRQQQGFTQIVISHDLGDVAAVTDRTLILYAGQVAELGSTSRILDDPRHPYTWGLMNAYPRMERSKDLWGIRGQPPDPMYPPGGCPFHPRCTQAVQCCIDEVPALEPVVGRLVACHLGGLQPLIQVRGLTKAFQDGDFSITGVDLTVREGEVVALVGQTGSGKTTLAKCLVGLYRAEAGEVTFEGENLAEVSSSELHALRARIQFIMQDPFEALSPRLTVLELVREPLDIRDIGTRAECDARARGALADVRLPVTPEFLTKHGHELSGGQLQRVAIARALVLAPKLIIADEPVAMLDASEQAKVLRLLKDVQNERGMGLLLISHDLALVRKVADRILVMHEGEIVEEGPAHMVLLRPTHHRTRALIAAATHGAGLDGVRPHHCRQPRITLPSVVRESSEASQHKSIE